MPVVKIMQHGQITIPKKFREILNLREGDLAEAELNGDLIIITPKRLVKDRSLKELFELMDKIHERNREFTEEEVADDVMKAIAEFREEEYAERKNS